MGFLQGEIMSLLLFVFYWTIKEPKAFISVLVTDMILCTKSVYTILKMHTLVLRIHKYIDINIFKREIDRFEPFHDYI
jgi:hypothetical protein